MDDPDVFVVRIWHRLAGGFGASVRRVDEEETYHFAQPEELTRFLTAAGEQGTALDEAVKGSASSSTASD
jgi:hypothetical protein